MKAPITVLILSGLFLLESTAQSLPEIARQIRAQRTQSRTGPVFTNENIAQAGATLANAATARTPAAVTDSSATSDAPGTEPEAEESVGGRTQQGWRDAFADARAEIARSESLAQLQGQELDALNLRLLTESSLFNREGQLTPLIAEKQAEIEATDQRIVDANQALTDLTAELRRAGGPPGWAR